MKETNSDPTSEMRKCVEKNQRTRIMIGVVLAHFLIYALASCFYPHFITKKIADFEDKYLPNVFPN